MPENSSETQSNVDRRTVLQASSAAAMYGLVTTNASAGSHDPKTQDATIFPIEEPDIKVVDNSGSGSEVTAKFHRIAEVGEHPIAVESDDPEKPSGRELPRQLGEELGERTLEYDTEIQVASDKTAKKSTIDRIPHGQDEQLAIEFQYRDLTETGFINVYENGASPSETLVVHINSDGKMDVQTKVKCY